MAVLGVRCSEWQLVEVRPTPLGDAVAVTAILGRKARGFLSRVTSMAVFLSASWCTLLWHCLQLQSSQ